MNGSFQSICLISHDLLIAKLHAYDFSEYSLTFFYSYLKRHKQNVKINNTYNLLKELLSRVPQGSNLFLWLSIANLHNFADDNTISAFSQDLKDLIKK